jgi:hypothetical protein
VSGSRHSLSLSSFRQQRVRSPSAYSNFGLSPNVSSRAQFQASPHARLVLAGHSVVSLGLAKRAYNHPHEGLGAFGCQPGQSRRMWWPLAKPFLELISKTTTSRPRLYVLIPFFILSVSDFGIWRTMLCCNLIPGEYTS